MPRVVRGGGGGGGAHGSATRDMGEKLALVTQNKSA
jgi:hypothetical protein